MKNYYLLIFGLLVFISGCNTEIGEVTLTYTKASAVYGDIDQVRATPLAAAPRLINNPGKIFMGGHFLLVGEEGEGIHVFDNTDPNSPVPVVFIQLPFTNQFYVEKNFVYAETHYDFVKIDLSNFASPVLVDRVKNAFADPIVNDFNETLIGFDFNVVTESFQLNSAEANALEKTNRLYYDYMDDMIPPSEVLSSFAGNGTADKGSLNRIAVVDDYVYVIGDNDLYIFSDAIGDMEYLSRSGVQDGLETIYPEGNNLFIGTRNSMIIMDISDAKMPVHISEYWHATSCDPVYPNGDVAYLTLRTGDFSGCSGDENSLVVLDISDLTNPAAIVTKPMTSPYGMCIVNNFLFVGEGQNGLTMFDINAPRNPGNSATQNVEVYDVMPHPTESNRILTAGSNGLSQYEVDFNRMTVTLLSDIAF